MSTDFPQLLKSLRSLIGNGDDCRCPMCGCKNFVVMSDVGRVLLSKDMAGNLFHQAPTALLYCEHCGFVSQHLIGVVSPESLRKANDRLTPSEPTPPPPSLKTLMNRVKDWLRFCIHRTTPEKPGA